MGAFRDLHEVLRGLKRKGTAPKLCPVCGSSKLRLSSSLDIWLTPGQYLCEDCRYKGPIVMEVESEERPPPGSSRSEYETDREEPPEN